MPRRRLHIPLQVFSNDVLVGQLIKEPSGAIFFRYASSWLDSETAVPLSLSLPLREDAYRGEAVTSVFENLLPDSDQLKRRIAEKVGAQGIDAYSLLSQIGRDCVGALQFVPSTETANAPSAGIQGEVVGADAIAHLLQNLAKAPLGLESDQDFRMSVAGAQEKTALLYHQRKWWKPFGTTPTTHILKPQIGTLPNGLDLSHSVENEFYCLKLLAAFGLPVAHAEVQTFGKVKVLVVERFDRAWDRKNHLLRLPVEDLCQALGCPPSRKYQSEGGPGIVEILDFLKGADSPAADQKTFLQAQIVFWLIGATDGHAKNFSVFLGPGGTFRMAPLYDVLTAQPSAAARQIERKQMKLAVSVGHSRHYRLDEIHGRHFVQSAEHAGLPRALAQSALTEVADTAAKALDQVEEELSAGFPRKIHAVVRAGIISRLGKIRR